MEIHINIKKMLQFKLRHAKLISSTAITSWKAGADSKVLMGEFKQEILRINNEVNMMVFSQGLLAQRAIVFDDKVLIVAKNRRVRALHLVDELDRKATEAMDRALILQHKRLFILEVKQQLGLTVLSHLKDYDPKLEISISVSIFERPVEELIPSLFSPIPERTKD